MNHELDEVSRKLYGFALSLERIGKKLTRGPSGYDNAEIEKISLELAWLSSVVERISEKS